MQEIEDKTLRKYMNLPQFISLINKNAIYFPKFNELDDPCEGIIPRPKSWENSLMDESESKLLPTLDESIKSTKLVLETEDIHDVFLKFNVSISDKIEKELNKIKNNVQIDKIEESQIILRFEEFIFSMLKDIKANIDIIEHLQNPETNTKALLEKKYKNNFRKLMKIDLNEMLSNKTIISCWHIGSSESDGMWKIYSSNDGIAIETKQSKLDNLKGLDKYRNTDDYLVDNGKVQYKYYTDLIELFENYSPEKLIEILEKEASEIKDAFNEIIENIHKLFLRKRSCFEYENEYRIIITPDLDKSVLEDEKLAINKKDQYILTGNLDFFIDKIIISPYAPDFYKDTIIDLLKHSKNKNIRKLAEKVQSSEITESNNNIKNKLKEFSLIQ